MGMVITLKNKWKTIKTSEEIKELYKEAVEIYKLFYANKKCMFLQRKKDKFDELLTNKIENFACL